MTMVTCCPIVFPKVSWIQHLQINFDFNTLDMVQIFKSMLMVIDWCKTTEIAQYFYKWCFSIFITNEKMWKEKGLCGYRHQKEQPCRVEPQGTPNTAWAKSPSKCYNTLLFLYYSSIKTYGVISLKSDIISLWTKLFLQKFHNLYTTRLKTTWFYSTQFLFE